MERPGHRESENETDEHRGLVKHGCRARAHALQDLEQKEPETDCDGQFHQRQVVPTHTGMSKRIDHDPDGGRNREEWTGQLQVFVTAEPHRSQDGIGMGNEIGQEMHDGYRTGDQ